MEWRRLKFTARLLTNLCSCCSLERYRLPTGPAPRAIQRSAKETRHSGARSPLGAQAITRRARRWRSGAPPLAHFLAESAAASWIKCPRKWHTRLFVKYFSAYDVKWIGRNCTPTCYKFCHPVRKWSFQENILVRWDVKFWNAARESHRLLSKHVVKV